MKESEIMSLEESISEEIVSMNPMSIVEDFSDEILLKIFSFLDSEDIVNCVPVHEKFRRIAFDDFLWRGVSSIREKQSFRQNGTFRTDSRTV